MQQIKILLTLLFVIGTTTIINAQNDCIKKYPIKAKPDANPCDYDLFTGNIRSYFKCECERKKKEKPKKEIKENEKIKEEEREKKSEAELKAEWYVKMRTQALTILDKAKYTSNSSKKIKLLKQAKSFKDYLTNEEYNMVKDELFSTTSRAITSDLVKVDWGYDDRHLLLMANTGLNVLFGGYGKTQMGIPLTLNTELTFPISKTLAIEIQGEYSFNYILKLGDAGSILNALGGDVEPLPNSGVKTESKSRYGKYYYGLGMNFGVNRDFSFLILSHGVKFYHREIKDGKLEIEVGNEAFMPTYGLGIAYNFQGKNKQELGRLMGSYSINNKNLSFIKTDYELNDASNINLKYEGGYGAFLFGIEYNLFRDKITDLNLSTISLKLGAKIGL